MRLTPRLRLCTTLMMTTVLLGALVSAAQAIAEAAIAKQAIVNLERATPSASTSPLLISQIQDELEAFWASSYTFWDAAVLAQYWGQSMEDSKARIGRKIGFGPADVAILEQFLLDARISALLTVENLELYFQSDYTYDDAAILAEFWGDPSPYDSKLRIERNLIMGQKDWVDAALQLATE
ncbi:MAG: hypothetical protein VKJ64_00810 [Leptolyngbyaceae bacterium]|nr:hypothetical protein [Leptolyngbyaceae bacterium]